MQIHLSRGAAFCAALAISASALSAQVAPFSRSGMQLLPWGPGKSFTLSSLAWVPTSVRLEFEYDALVGVALRKISHRTQTNLVSARIYDYEATPPTGIPRGLWSAVLRPITGQQPLIMGPESAQRIQVWVNSTSQARTAIFRWEGMRAGLPAQNVGATWMELKVEIPYLTPERSVWSSRFVRAGAIGGTQNYTLDELHAPIVNTRQPGDSRLARLLIPVAGREPMPIANASMRIWQVVGLGLDLSHPTLGQQMQFSALYAGDPTEARQGLNVHSAYRKVLYFGTEDTSGHQKRFQHLVYSGPSGEAYYRFASKYLPTYRSSPRVSEFVSPYPTVVSALAAQSDAYWYDVAAYYRNFVRLRLDAIPMRSPLYPGNPDAAKGAVVLATSSLPAFFSDLDDVFDTYVDAAEDLARVFPDPATGRKSKLFMEWQKWLIAEASVNESLSGPDFNPVPYTGVTDAPLQPPSAVRDAIARADRLGINVSVYTLPLRIDRQAWGGFDPNGLLRNRAGSVLPFSGAEHADIGHPSVPLWYRNVFFKDILNSVPGLGGLYLDAYGGLAGSVRYPATSSEFFRGDYNGGDGMVRNAKRVLDEARASIASQRTGTQHPNLPFLATESVQEFLVGSYDAAQHGVKPIPFHTQLSTFVDGLVSNRLDSVDATANNPPLWNAVYHEYSRAEVLGMMLSTRAVSQSLGGGQSGAKPGVTWKEWADYNRMLPALMLAQGVRPATMSYFYNFKADGLLVRRSGGIEVADPSNARQRELLAFFQRVHECFSREAEGGRFLQAGVFARPLALPARVGANLPAGLVSQQLNPSVAAHLAADPLPGVTQSYYEDAFTQTIPYPVASVFHSVWREHPLSTRVGIVFVNWTDAPAAWQGAFDPGAYLPGVRSFRVTGVRPNGAGIQTYPIGSGNGVTPLSWRANAGAGALSLRHHSQSTAGLMPPRSVQVIWVDLL